MNEIDRIKVSLDALLLALSVAVSHPMRTVR